MKLPSFIDSHLHFLGLGYVSENVDLNNASSIEEVLVKLKMFKNKPIIIGRGWNQANFKEARMLTKNDLNKVSTNIPIILIRVCGHVLTVNDKMLELASINQDTPQIDGGSFDYETGIFSENALALIYDCLPKPTELDLERYIITANKLLLENGITHVASDDFSTLSIPYETVLNVFDKLYKEDKIQVKLTEQVNLPIAELEDFIEKGYVNKVINENFKMGPLKILADGSLGGKTAALLEAYEDDPNNLGILTYTDTELFNLVHLANKNEMDVVIHAIGDRTIDQALKVLIKSIKLTNRYNHNHAIIHAQLANKFQIKLMKEYNIGAIIQPIFLNSDIKIVEDRIGSRYLESYLFNTMNESGVRVGFSTDAPIEPINPFMNIYCAVKRRSVKNPNLSEFLIEEGISLEDSLKCYTENNLDFINEPKLSDGDYIVTDREINEDNILDVKILETYIDNKLVYKKKAD